jgi:hypothetical protein
VTYPTPSVLFGKEGWSNLRARTILDAGGCSPACVEWSAHGWAEEPGVAARAIFCRYCEADLASDARGELFRNRMTVQKVREIASMAFQDAIKIRMIRRPEREMWGAAYHNASRRTPNCPNLSAVYIQECPSRAGGCSVAAGT